MFDSCEKKGKSLFDCDHNKKSNSSSNQSNQWYNLLVEIYLQVREIINIDGEDQYNTVDTQIFKGISAVRFKKKYIVTNSEYQVQGTEVWVRVPIAKINAVCNLNNDLTKMSFKYLNSHTKTFDIIKVLSYDPDGWGNTVILIGNLNYAENI